MKRDSGHRGNMRAGFPESRGIGIHILKLFRYMLVKVTYLWRFVQSKGFILNLHFARTKIFRFEIQVRDNQHRITKPWQL